MAPRLQIVATLEEHAYELALRMRLADREEIYASGHFEPLDGVLRSIDASEFVRTVMLNGKVAAIYGVVPMSITTRAGCVWMLTTNDVERYPLTFLRESKRALQRLTWSYHVLVNAIDARHKKALKWARWAGFEVGEPVPFGAEGRPFHHIKLQQRERRVALSASR